MSKLFESTKIRSMTMPNRFVRSATWEGMAGPDGSVTPLLTDTMVGLAKGGVGLTITGLAYPRKSSQAMPWQLGVYDDSAREKMEGTRTVFQVKRGVRSSDDRDHSDRGSATTSCPLQRMWKPEPCRTEILRQLRYQLNARSHSKMSQLPNRES